MPDEIKPYTAPQYIKRAAPDGNPAQIDPLKGVIEGCPIVFNQRTAIGDLFYEEIDPHALDDADITDIKFMVNHNDGMIPLARHRRGKRSTMDVEIKPDGLHVRTTLDIENNATARELCSAVTRGDIEDMSFAFGVLVSGYEWRDLDTDMPTRRITKISKVFEVSAVNDGAYPQTSIYARSPASLDNDKIALANAKAAALENEQRRQADESQAAAKLEQLHWRPVVHNPVLKHSKHWRRSSLSYDTIFSSIVLNYIVHQYKRYSLSALSLFLHNKHHIC